MMDRIMLPICAVRISVPRKPLYGAARPHLFDRRMNDYSSELNYHTIYGLILGKQGEGVYQRLGVCRFGPSKADPYTGGIRGP